MTFNAGTAGICDATTIVQLAVIGAVVNTLPINEPPQPVTLCSVAPPVKVIAKESTVPSGTLEGIGGVAVNDDPGETTEIVRCAVVHATLTLVTLAPPTVPVPLVTTQVCAGPDGCVCTVTA